MTQWWSSFEVKAGQTLALGQVDATTGVRGYLAVQGGINVPLYLGSRSTFPGGKFGGHQGRNLLIHDSLPIGVVVGPIAAPTQLPSAFLPSKGHVNQDGSALWEVGVLPGPHADPDYLTSPYMDDVFYKLPFKVSPLLFSLTSPSSQSHAHTPLSTFQVHYNSNRLGVRLVGQVRQRCQFYI